MSLSSRMNPKNHSLFSIVLSENLKFFIVFFISVAFGFSIIVNNPSIYLITAFVLILFLSTVIIYEPHLFISVFLAVSYPVSHTVGKIGVSNIGISTLMSFALLSMMLSFKRNGFAIEKQRISVFLYFTPIVLTVLFGFFYGMVKSGTDSIEIFSKFVVFGMLPVFMMMFIPLKEAALKKILNLTYYIMLTIFLGFTIAYVFFRTLNPNGFYDFFYSFDNPIGTSFFMTKLILISCLFLKVNPVTGYKKVFVISSIAVSVFYVVSIFQRSFLVAIVLAVIYYLFISYKISFKKIFLLCLTFVMFVIVAYNVATFIDPERMYKLERTVEFVEKMSGNTKLLRTKDAQQFGTIGYRIIKIIAVVEKTRENPYMGNGLGTFSRYTGFKYAHNIFLEFLYSTGFIGLIIVVLFLAQIFVKIEYNIRKIKAPEIVKLFRLAMPFVVLYMTVLQFTGGIMIIFPHVFFMMYTLLLLSSRAIDSAEQGGVK